ncbi:MAG: metal-dependent transcriptional regulator [Archaeoglobaceae archaeon]|nr:metal-dependent transcriptional regulator [Archaeoglobaceae archaeon]MDW7990152.1 metal-dependent transcriptional regulator [Archaeoglobaceae archaeon]
MERIEEYLEAIYDLQKKGKVAKTGDLAKILNVKPASVTEMLLKLKEKGYVDYSPYRGVILTRSGEKIAEKVKKHYLIASSFFKYIGIDENVAEKLGCELEHHMSEEVAEKLSLILDYRKCKDCRREIKRLSCVNDGVYVVVSSPGNPRCGEKIIVENGIAKKEDGTRVEDEDFILVVKS